MERIPFLPLCCGVVLALAAGAAPAVTVYKWVDERGRVHFSDQPRGHAVESVQVRTGGRYVEEPPPAEPAPKKAEEQAAAAGDGRQQAALSPAEARKAERERRKQRRKNCALARENLARNERISRMYRVDESGARIWLTEAEREAVLEKARRDVKHWCGKKGRR